MPFGSILGGLIGGIGSIFGASQSASAAKDAAQIQAQAANNATQLQRDIFNQTTQNLTPFYGSGVNALAALNAGVGSGFDPNSPLLANAQNVLGPPPSFPNLPTFNPTGFQQSPGYQWQLGQGINAIQNSAAGKTGSVSGNTLKALQTYGTGLANQDYYNWINQIAMPQFQSQFQATLLPYEANNSNYWNTINQYNQTQANQFNRLAALSSGGQSAAAMQGNFGQNFGAQAGQNIIGAGNALAAGQVGAANAITGGVNSLSTNALTMGNGLGNALSSLFGGGSPNTSYLNNPGVVNALWNDPSLQNAGDFSSF